MYVKILPSYQENCQQIITKIFDKKVTCYLQMVKSGLGFFFNLFWFISLTLSLLCVSEALQMLTGYTAQSAASFSFGINPLLYFLLPHLCCLVQTHHHLALCRSCVFGLQDTMSFLHVYRDTSAVLVYLPHRANNHKSFIVKGTEMGNITFTKQDSKLLNWCHVIFHLNLSLSSRWQHRLIKKVEVLFQWKQASSNRSHLTPLWV